MLTLWRKQTAPEAEEQDVVEADTGTQDEQSDGSGKARGDDSEPNVAHGWTNGERLKSMAATALIWGLCATGPLALGLEVLGDDGGSQQTSAEVQEVGDSQRVSQFATSFVTQYLTASRGQEDQVTSMLAEDASRNLRLPETRTPIGAALPGEAVQTADGTWIVTVEVDQPGDEAEAAVRRYWQVPIVTNDGGGIAAAGMPSLVSAPAAGGLKVEPGAEVNDSDVQDTVTAFMQAFLTGQGEVAPLTSPDSSLAAVEPTPFTEVSVSSITTTQELPAEPTDGDLIRAQVSLSATAADGNSTPLGYTVELRYRDRWEVAAVNPTTAVTTTTTGEQS